MASLLTAYPVPPPLGGLAVRETTAIPPGMLAASENWYSREQSVQLRAGLTQLGQSIFQRPTGLISYLHNDGIERLVVGTTEGWWRYEIGTATWVDISPILPLQAGGSSQQVFRVFQKSGTTTLLGVNGIDTPKKWDGNAATLTELGGTPPIARTMMVLGNRLMLGFLTSGATQSSTAIDVSAFNDFDSGWGSVETGLLADTPGPIIAMQEMGGLTGAIWKSDALYLAIAQGGLAPFRFELRLAGIAGPASPNAVVPLQDGTHLYLANDYSVKLFNGAGLVNIGGEQGSDLQRHLQRTANSLLFDRSFGVRDKYNNLVWFFYPGTGETACGRAVAIDLTSMAFWPMRWANAVFTAGYQAVVGSGLTIGELSGTIGDFTADTGLTIGELSGTIGALSGTIGAIDAGLTIGDFATSTPRVVTCRTGGQLYVDIGQTDAGAPIPFVLETGLLRNTPQVITVSEVKHLFVPPVTPQTVTARIGISQAGEPPAFDAGDALTIARESLATPQPAYISQHRATGELFALRLEGEATETLQYRGASVAFAPRGRR